MRLVKVKKKVFKRQFLDFRLLVVVFDICEMNQDEEETTISVNRVYHVLPATAENEIDIESLMPPSLGK